MDPNGIFGTNNTMPGQIDVAGASVQGQIKCDYDDLVHVFGAPIESESEFSWLIMFNDYTVAKLHGAKSVIGSVYWDIDGFDNTAFIRVSTAVQRSLKEPI